MKKILAIILIAALVLGTFGCASMSRKEKGAAIGGASGAAVGAAIGSKSGNTLLGAILGAAVGGVAGAYIGNYMDKQAAEIEQDLQGAQVERVGEGIKVTFDSGILFDVNKATLRPEAQANLRDLARILNKYPDTNVLIEGHTDATGSEEYNLELSRARAQAVANFLAGMQVDPTRFTIMGYGESQPIASNESVEGRQANRRVELAIMANDKLKKVAESRAG
jgi:outer membrane protein OmpA-like peptidoglycan-associated protein